MTISSVNTNWANILNVYASQGTSNITSNAAANSTSSNAIKGVTGTNSDGDTYQMSVALPPAPAMYNSSGADYDPSSFTGSTSSQTTSLSATEMFSQLDADSDGSLTEAEFIAGRPSDVTEEMAKNLYSSLDTDSSSTLSETEYGTRNSGSSDADSESQALAASMMMPPPPPILAYNGSSESDSDSSSSISSSQWASDVLSALDTDGDGALSRTELEAAYQTQAATGTETGNTSNHSNT